ncbi:MAG: archaeosortase C [Halobacteriota archaeon]
MLGYRNIILFLLIIALFLGATVEISEGSDPLGILLFIIAVLLISQIKVGESYMVSRSKLSMYVGALIIISVIAYNLFTYSKQDTLDIMTFLGKLGTLDIMTFLLGLSLIAHNINNEEIRRMGSFGAYMSATFIVLFLLFFSLFNYLNIDFMHLFDHYFVLLPSLFVIRMLGFPIQVIAIEMVRIEGTEEMSVIIGGPCSGLYSMFLLIGIMVAYTRIEHIERRKFYPLLVITIGVAYLANLVRVSILYITGFYYGKEVMYAVHVHLGWIIFVIVVAVLLYVLDRITR